MPTRQIVKTNPLNAESPPVALEAAVTATGLHYVRTNFSIPSIVREQYSLAVTGAVAQSRTLAWDELRGLPRHQVTVTMECAGNDRLGLYPLPAGEPWRSGAVSTAAWRGVRLRDVLQMVQPHDNVLEIVAQGADHGPRADANAAPDVIFERALPLDAAQHPDTLLALEMNGELLPPEHGAPIRLIVPGWYGMANVKWVTHLRAVTEPFTGYFQRRRYVYQEAGGERVVTLALVKSMIVSPSADAVLQEGAPCVVKGWAWSGHGVISRVEVAVGGGDEWCAATLAEPVGTHAWTPWSFEIPALSPGRLVLRSRATDAAGFTQPDVAVWNALGYGNNAVRPVVFDVQLA